MASLDWDIFCRVIDNHGDIGVCWRLARQLAARRHRVRLWVDNASALTWMAPGRLNLADGIDVRRWSAGSPGPDETPGDVVVEAFGCELDDPFVAAMKSRADTGRPSLWVNLEYLSAEAWVERNHGLRSPVLSGPGAGLEKLFFYPGFTDATGGLLREDRLMHRRDAFDRAGWLAAQGVETMPRGLIASLFCYEPPQLPALLAQLPPATALLVTAGRATAAARSALESGSVATAARLTWLPAVAQPQFDELLWSCDLNFVRGEDSLVRALWAGSPFVWQIYPQHDDAHHAKLEAFLDWLNAPASLRTFSRAWNGIGNTRLVLPEARELADWTACTLDARGRLLAQHDLCTQLERRALGFTAARH